jgi:hypothetical protein
MIDRQPGLNVDVRSFLDKCLIGENTIAIVGVGIKPSEIVLVFWHTVPLSQYLTKRTVVSRILSFFEEQIRWELHSIFIKFLCVGR